MKNQKQQQDSIILFEEKYRNIAENFRKIQEKQYELFSKKMLDYGINNISLGSSLDNEEELKMALFAIWVRSNDKINRIKELSKRNGEHFVQDEKLEDTWIDLSIYAVIAQIVAEGNWKK